MKFNDNKMNFREKFSAGLLCMGVILAILPLSGNRSFIVKPRVLLPEILDEKSYFTVDQVARFIVSEDTTVQIIDLRSAKEFRTMNIPGSINAPYPDLFKSPGSLFSTEKIRNILYSNGDSDSNSALVMAMGLNYKNVFVMRGGMNEWFNTVMNSSFTGEKISARENAIFETRTRARNMFNDLNSLPDSLKMKFIEGKRIAAKKLDGGCE
jgi:rhodanese-related sulfurtransferase